jgi:hypothetical protein
MKLQRGMMMIDEKNVFTEGNLTGEYVHTDEDRVTVPSSRVNNNNDNRMPPLKSNRGGDTSQRSMYSHNRDMGSSSIEEINHSLK